jgi:hypothetical protein
VAQIADDVFGSEASLQEGRQLYRDVEKRLALEDRELLAKLYKATLAHEEKFEHAAYLVGLLAGSGELPETIAFLDERRPTETTREGDGARAETRL